MNNFEKIVSETHDISKGYCSGLSALKSDASYVVVNAPRQLDGSVDIDTCTKALYPKESRWDYVVSYNGKAFFMEVHPATVGEIKEVEKKLGWLKQWLEDKAKSLGAYPYGVPRFTWVHSGKCGLSKESREYKRMAQKGLVLRKRLELK